MKDTELKLVCELVKNSRKSDRELAKLIGVSQPTVSRIRTRLEREEVISYSGSVNLRKLGFEIIAITYGNLRPEIHSETETRVHKAQDFLKGHSNIVFFSTGRGLNSDRVAVSVHKSYADYAKFMGDLKTDWTEMMTITGSFLISLDSDNVLRPLSLKYIADCLEKEKPGQKSKAS